VRRLPRAAPRSERRSRVEQAPLGEHGRESANPLAFSRQWASFTMLTTMRTMATTR